VGQAWKVYCSPGRPVAQAAAFANELEETRLMPFAPKYHVPPERRAYTLEAGPVGCLMLHGFMGSPTSSRPMAEHLAQRGITVHCPLLPGHGELPNKLEGARREDWIGEAEEAFAFLKGRCQEIFLMGHSMGTTLNAHLAVKHGGVRGIIMLAPAYTVPSRAIHLLRPLKYVLPWFYPLRFRRLHALAYERLHDVYPDLDLKDAAVQARLPEMTRVPTDAVDEMNKMLAQGRRLWPRVDEPVLIFQGGEDIAVDEATTETLFGRLASQDKELVFIPEAGHELMRPFDPVHTQVWPRAAAFIESRSELLGAAPEEALVPVETRP
jgi:carboxylesterase